MTEPGILTIATAALAYFAAVTVIGLVAGRGSSRSPEDHFLAGRGLGTVVLFMARSGGRRPRSDRKLS